MKRAMTSFLALGLSILGCHKAHDEGGADVDDQDVGDDMAQIDLPQECAEGERLLYPGPCLGPEDTEPELYGCYLWCEFDPCPQGQKCIEAWHNPCWEGWCANCAELVHVCVEDSGT